MLCSYNSAITLFFSLGLCSGNGFTQLLFLSLSLYLSIYPSLNICLYFFLSPGQGQMLCCLCCALSFSISLSLFLCNFFLSPITLSFPCRCLLSLQLDITTILIVYYFLSLSLSLSLPDFSYLSMCLSLALFSILYSRVYYKNTVQKRKTTLADVVSNKYCT